MAKIKREDVLEYLESANMIEVSELINEIEDKFGVSAAVPVAVAADGPVADSGAAEEKSEFDVELTTIGEKKINVIKVIREITSLGLKEAKDLVDNAPSKVKEAISKDEAANIQGKLEAAGATVTLK